MRIPFLSGFNRKIGIDLGSERVRIVVDKIGLVADEPARIAVQTKTGKLVAVGDDALAMEGRVQPPIQVVAPVQEGVIFDHKAAGVLIQALLQRVFPRSPLISPVLMASFSGIAQPADRQILNELLYDLGAREVYLISAPLAASIGAGVPIADASGCFLMHLGESVVEGAVIALGSTVKQVHTVTAGKVIRQMVQRVCRRQLNLVVSSEVAQQIIEHVVTADPNQDRQQLVAGADVATTSPTELIVRSQDFREESMRIVAEYVRLLRELLTNLPPELTVDVIDKGLLLSGGLSQLAGLDQYLVASLGIPVSVVDNPSRTVSAGMHTALEHLGEFKTSLGYRTQ